MRSVPWLNLRIGVPWERGVVVDGLVGLLRILVAAGALWRCGLAGEVMEERDDAFAGGGVRLCASAGLARPFDPAGGRASGRSVGTNRCSVIGLVCRPEVVDRRPNEGSCLPGSVRSHGTVLPCGLGWLAAVGLDWVCDQQRCTPARAGAC